MVRIWAFFRLYMLHWKSRQKMEKIKKNLHLLDILLFLVNWPKDAFDLSLLELLLRELAIWCGVIIWLLFLKVFLTCRKKNSSYFFWRLTSKIYCILKTSWKSLPVIPKTGILQSNEIVVILVRFLKRIFSQFFFERSVSKISIFW